MNTLYRLCFCTALVSVCLTVSNAQTPVHIGGGSIASFPPAYKAKTVDGGNGFNASAMLSRKVYADELPSQNDGSLEVPGECLPTNDWWTDIINSQYSGALWSYPSMISTSDAGVTVKWPSYWADMGKEMKSNSSLTVGAKGFNASATIAKSWHDWDVMFRMPAKSGDGEITVTSVHGSPFTWFEYSGLVPSLDFSTTPELIEKGSLYAAIRVGSDLYGLYYPSGSDWSISGDKLLFDSECDWLVVALLRNVDDLNNFADYAVSIPRATTVDWNYDETSARVATRFTVEAQNLRDASSAAPVMQGFLPHVYKYMLGGSSLSFMDADGFMTPRGRLKLATSANGVFSYEYQFSGMLPVNGAPTDGQGFRSEVLDKLMKDYASGGGFGGDTYWGGKGLTQMALNMWYARQAGNTEVYETSKKKLRDALEDWLTYSPGEDTFFFSYYPRWGGMLGFDVSYDSDSFNDHHFHYGYFTYAAALLCMEDKDFAEKYGEILTMIAKDYANWDRDDARFPFMRTLDIWNGHSWAGGLGDHGNDNGNGQESSSEAMQSWGGLYLLGVALDNKEMRDAGIWGWSTEARATREYWFDVDAPRSANAGGRKSWPGKGELLGNYNYDEYPYAYNSNITGKGIGWWTWFGGDPLYMHGIQWMPSSTVLDYLSWDPDFVAWSFNDMMSGANSSFSHSWFEATSNKDNGENIDPLATNDWGAVALTYLQRTDPKQAAQIFDTALERNLHIANSVGTSHISYYTIHSHLTYGDPDFSIHSDIPTSQVCVKDGVATYFVYNPGDEDRPVNFYDNSGRLVKTVNAPARILVGISADPVPTLIEYEIIGGSIIPPGEQVDIVSRVLDQYGAGMNDRKVEISLSPGSPASISGNKLTVNGDALLGTAFSLTLSCGDITATEDITVNNGPKGEKSEIAGIPEFVEKNTSVNAAFHVTDQYGNVTYPADTRWSLTDATGNSEKTSSSISFVKAGKFKVDASSEMLQSSASASVTVTPSLPLMSLGSDVYASSAENVGTLPTGVNDGNRSTRWGSAHTDNEWIVLDLGTDCFISRVSVDWEAAFASRYEIQTAPSGCDMISLNVDYAGQQKVISVPAENAWTTAADVRISSPGEKNEAISSRGRYVRIKGVERSTAYGYSIYELNVYGMRLDADATDVLGIDFDLPETMDCNQTYQIVPTVYSYDGSIVETTGIEWKSDKTSRFEAGEFTPLEPGLHTVSASLPGGIVSENTVYVNDVERPVAMQFERDSYTVIAGEEIYVPFTVTNQFMAPYTGDIGFLEVLVTDDQGQPAALASYNPESMIFKADISGDYKIVFGSLGSCYVAVRPLGEVNLALDKPASASSVNGNNYASLANDGNTDTRWESSWEDNQYLEIDLGDYFMIDRSVIVWEGAYAKEYSLAVSGDGEKWFEFYSETAGKGGTESLQFEPLPARYVRLNCIKRATGYGSSVKEFEIYGISRLEEAGSIAPSITEFDVETANGVISVASSAVHNSGSVFMDLSVYNSAGDEISGCGAAVASGDVWTIGFDQLRSGIYSVRLVASDIFGNSSEEIIEDIKVTYSIVGINLALNKEAYASSHENAGLAAPNAVDGDLSTRWGSLFNDDEWIIVDLGTTYSLTDVKIHWNSPAYATDFTIEVSNSGKEDRFTPVHVASGFVNNGNAYSVGLDKGTEGRFVKITGNRRATQYGTSIDEIEVYGDDFVTHIGNLDDETPAAKYYNLQGLPIDKPVPGQVVIMRQGSRSQKRVSSW